VTRLGLVAWRPLLQTRSKSKASSKKSKADKEAERNIVVKLLQDTPRFGRAGMWPSQLGAMDMDMC
jgi:hypothetical protein